MLRLKFQVKQITYKRQKTKIPLHPKGGDGQELVK